MSEAQASAPVTQPEYVVPVQKFDAGSIRRYGHGGFCCGMTHLYHFPPNPDNIVKEREKLSEEAYLASQKASVLAVRSPNEAYPEQTAKERLIETLNRITAGTYNPTVPRSYGPSGGRPMGIVEVVLTSRDGKGYAITWKPCLEELGFTEVNTAMNSNSRNRLHIFHLNTGQ